MTSALQSDHASSATYLPFDARSPVWADVKPVPQDDGPSPLCPILYSPDYSQAMDLLRALLPADELSPRTLALTEHLSKKCPSSYTVWYFRARILTNGPEGGPNGLGSKRDRLLKELVYLDDLARVNMKNYQVWQHRKLIVLALGDPSRELAFTAQVLDEDCKNYHTWVYRQWVLSHFGGLPQSQDKAAKPTSDAEHSDAAGQFSRLWHGELDYVASLLQTDARNNSAWNHRFFCIFGARWAHNTHNDVARRLCADQWKIGASLKGCMANEIAYAKDHVKMIPHNASAWNYLRGVSRLQAQQDGNGNPYAVAVDLAETLIPVQRGTSVDLTTDEPPNTPPLALEWLLDDVDARIQRADLSDDAAVRELLTRAETLYVRLCVADVIRKRYWTYRMIKIRKAANSH